MRLIATGGIIGIAVILGAVLVGQDVAGWIVGLVVGPDLGDPGRAALVVAAALAVSPAHKAQLRPFFSASMIAACHVPDRSSKGGGLEQGLVELWR